MFDKLKIKSKGNNLPVSNSVDAGKAPTKKQIYQLRTNFGVNFGGCFVLEKWIYHLIFPDNTDCELSAVTQLVKDKGEDGAREALEHHWKNYVNDDDWKWLQDHGVTCVRVPIGYWDLPDGTKGTKFSSFSSVYKNAWSIFKLDFVEQAGKHNISVLVDLHGLPGGANGSDHSGEKGSGKAEFWGSSDQQLQISSSLGSIAKDLLLYENIAGIQIVNESEFADPPKAQLNYYKAAISLIRSADGQVPIVISDGWWPDQWVKLIDEIQNKIGGSLGVVVDHHCYRCFDGKDKGKAPLKIIGDLDGDLLTNLLNDGKGVDFMVGEYSCVLDGDSWGRDGEDQKRDQLVVDYGKKQLQLFFKRATFGSFFWTFKFESGNGGEWDFKTMCDKGALEGFQGKDFHTLKKLDEALGSNFDGHVNYWNEQTKGEKMDHERYKQGFSTAWNDAQAFADAGSKLGRVEAWKDSRKREHIKDKGELKYLWEWEQGFEKGLEEFYS